MTTLSAILFVPLTSAKTSEIQTDSHLQSEEDMAMYLDACLEEDPGDGSVVRAALNDIA
jgi:DNA-binding phage protein